MTAVAHKTEETDDMRGDSSRGSRADARERRDIVSGEVMPENRLLRFVADPDGQVVPDVAASDTVPFTFSLGGNAGTQTLLIAIQN